MKKIIIITIILIQFLAYSQFSGGSGTVLDPYQVATAADLDNIRNYLESSFIQTADIDLGVAPWNVGEGWEPIGDYDWTDPSKSFRGNYNGNDYEITNMYIDNPADSYVGVFGSSDGVFFQNMNVINFDITSGIFIGGVVGISYNDSISNCITQGFIDGDDYLGLLTGFFEGNYVKDCHVQGEINSLRGKTGGLIGDCNAYSIKNSSADVSIFSNGYFCGGLIGYCVDTELIDKCFTIVNITNNGYNIGGFIGSIGVITINPLIINECFSLGVLSSTSDRVGGFIGCIPIEEGFDEYVTISNCFTTVDVTGNDNVGGVTGRILEITSIENCYSSGTVSGSLNVGGFIGLIDSLNTVSVTNSYWDTDTSGLLTTAGNLGEGRSTIEMTDPHVGNTYIDWDFTDIWVEDVNFHNNGYPFLGWHDTSIDNNYELLTMNYELEQNYPNPFNNQTNIGYTLEDMGKVEISVYNGNGQLIQNLINKKQGVGMHSVLFNADNLNSGIYYYQLKIDGMVKETKKMLYLR
jgi:hypothetical protein